MRHRILPLILVVLLSGCERPPGETPSQPGRQEFFAVNTQLSVAANKKLIDDKETIIVAGNFTGHPKQGTEARYLDIKSGDVVLGDVKKEIRPGETATFDKLNLNPGALARIGSQPQVFLEVYSGRRSSKEASIFFLHGRSPCLELKFRRRW
jgi:hypothetical protein